MECFFVRYFRTRYLLTRSQSPARSFCENKFVSKYRTSALSLKKSDFFHSSVILQKIYASINPCYTHQTLAVSFRETL